MTKVDKIVHELKKMQLDIENACSGSKDSILITKKYENYINQLEIELHKKNKISHEKRR